MSATELNLSELNHFSTRAETPDILRVTDVEREDEEIRALKEEHQKVFDDMLRLTEIISSPKFGVSKKPEVAEVLNDIQVVDIEGGATPKTEPAERTSSELEVEKAKAKVLREERLRALRAEKRKLKELHKKLSSSLVFPELPPELQETPVKPGNYSRNKVVPAGSSGAAAVSVSANGEEGKNYHVVHDAEHMPMPLKIFFFLLHDIILVLLTVWLSSRSFMSWIREV